MVSIVTTRTNFGDWLELFNVLLSFLLLVILIFLCYSSCVVVNSTLALTIVYWRTKAVCALSTLRKKCPNTGKYGPEKTPYLDTFYALQILGNSLCWVVHWRCWHLITRSLRGIYLIIAAFTPFKNKRVRWISCLKISVWLISLHEPDHIMFSL